MITFGVTTTNRSFAKENAVALAERSTNEFTLTANFSPETAGMGPFESSGYDVPSLAVVNGRPAAVFALRYSNVLQYVRAADPFGIQWNEPAILATDSDNGYSCPSLAVIGGRPAVCYRDTNDVLRYMRALDLNGTNWSESVIVDSATDSGWANHMVEVDGHPGIAYQNEALNELRYAYSDTVAGTNAADWNVLTIDDEGDPGLYLSMAVIDGNPAIAYFENVSNDLWYVRALNSRGSVWNTPQNIVPDESSGIGVSLAEIQGRPAVAFQYYRDTHTNLTLLYWAADSVGSLWGYLSFPDTNATEGTYYQLGMYGGYPAVTYYDSENDDLVFVQANGSNAFSGFLWDTPIALATNGRTGIFPSMTEVRGAPAILYADYDEGRYEYIRSGNPPANSWIDWIAVEP